MRLQDLKAFAKHLENPCSLYLVVSKHRYRQEKALELFSLTVPVMHVGAVSISSIVQELETLSFFEKEKVIALQGVDKLSKGDTDQLIRVISRDAPGLTTILLADKLSSTAPLYKVVEKGGVVLEIYEEKPWEKERALLHWVDEEVKRRGKVIDRDAAELLVTLDGVSEEMLVQEIEKLATFVDKRIQRSDVRALCVRSSEESVFQLTDAVMSRRESTSLRCVQHLINDGVSLFVILRQMRTQLSNAFLIASLSGLGLEEVMRQFPKLGKKRIEKLLNDAKSFGPRALARAICAVDEAELLAKNSSRSHEMILERLITRIQ